MSTESIVTIAGVMVVPLMLLVIYIPDILKSWHTSKAEAVKSETLAANAALKRDMVARGFSADEIARVINAGSGAEIGAEPEAAEKPMPAAHR
jgi:hypothetical protein